MLSQRASSDIPCWTAELGANSRATVILVLQHRKICRCSLACELTRHHQVPPPKTDQPLGDQDQGESKPMASCVQELPPTRPVFEKSQSGHVVWRSQHDGPFRIVGHHVNAATEPGGICRGDPFRGGVGYHLQTVHCPGPTWMPLAQFRIFTARDTTTATVTNDARDCSIINNFAQAVSGIVSVGLKAVAFVNEV